MHVRVLKKWYMFPILIMNFFFAISTTIGMTLIPLLVTDSLGLSFFTLGLIEGSTEFISNILRLISGNLFDRMKNRRLLFVIPATLALVSKMILCIPNSLTVILSKIIERIANGTFAVPRDAYAGENTSKKGITLGLLSFSKSLGCVIGPLLVSSIALIFGSLRNNMFIIIFLACTFNFIGFFFSFSINTNRKIALSKKQDIFYPNEFKYLFKRLNLFFILSFIFFLGRFNDGVILLYLKQQGFPEWFYLSTISFFNFIMLLVSPIIGFCIDKGKIYFVIFLTVLMLFFSNIFFYNVKCMSWIFASFGLTAWGIQRSGAQIAFSAMMFKKIPVKYYGTIIGIYSVLSGIGIFIASLISGKLAQTSFSYVFMFSGSFSLLALIMLFKVYKKNYLHES